MAEFIFIVYVVGIVFFGIVARAYYLKVLEDTNSWGKAMDVGFLGSVAVLFWPLVMIAYVFGYPLWKLFDMSSKKLKEFL